jgi:predicted nucleotidyltransferase
MRKAVLQTLVYADIFNYPLTIEELYRFLITPKTLSFFVFKKNLEKIIRHDKLIKKKGEYLFLKGREKIILIRQKRRFWSQKKIKIAKKVTRWLKLIPWVKMVGITGALAMENADKNDDVDLLIVTAKRRLWLTRALTVFLMELLGCRRRPKDTQVADKICLNMFVDEDYLVVPEDERDLFSAHEVVQFKVLWEKDSCYQKFLKANLWAGNYLANSLDIKKLDPKDIGGEKKRIFLISQFLNFLEYFAYKIQLAYMSSRRTNEIVQSQRVRFHPQDCREWILKKYQEKLKEYSKNIV